MYRLHITNSEVCTLLTGMPGLKVTVGTPGPFVSCTNMTYGEINTFMCVNAVGNVLIIHNSFRKSVILCEVFVFGEGMIQLHGRWHKLD